MTTPLKEVHRLSPEAYSHLAAKCPQIAVTNDTSPMQAGFQLGVQHVLKLLREGLVAERPTS